MRFALPLVALGSLALLAGCGGSEEKRQRVDPATLGQAGSGTAGTSSVAGSGGKPSKAGAGGASAGSGGTAAGAGGASAGSGGASAGSGGAGAGNGGASAGGAGGAPGGSGGASAGGTSGQGGATGGGASGGAGSPPYVGPDGNGTVAAVDDASFEAGALFGETATISADASDPSKPPAAMWLGSGKFSISGVAIGERVWFTATPTKSPTGYLSTLSAQTVPADGVTDLVVPVVKTAVMESVAGGALDASMGYVVLVIRAPSGAVVQGAKVKPAGAGQVFYDTGAGFSSAAQGTGAKGLAVVPNAPPSLAAIFNVTGTTTGAEGPVNVDLDQPVRVQAKAVSIVPVTLAP